MTLKRLTKIVLLILPLICLSNCNLTIIGPPELAYRTGDKPLDIVFGNFGEILEGVSTRGTINFEIISPENTGCSDLAALHFSFTSDNFGDDFPILLVKRGRCSFVQKARNAQQAGAAMLLVMNTDDNIHNVIMADDGTGGDIKIPVAMISKTTGELLESFIKSQNKRIEVDINFERQKTDKIDFKFFFSSSEVRAYELINKLNEYFKEFTIKINFIPIYVSHREPNYEVQKTTELLNCVSLGKYCYFPKENTISSSGQRILIEDIRQKCMYNMSKSKKKSNYYLDYMKKFLNKCILMGGKSKYNMEDNQLYNTATNELVKPTSARFNEKCGGEVLEEMGLSKDYLNSCIANSFQVSDLETPNYRNNDNTVLRNDYNEIITNEVRSFPAILINKVPITGMINENSIMTQLCKTASVKPDICQMFQGIVEQTVEEVAKSSRPAILILIVILVAINFGIYFVCRKYIVKRIAERINSSNIDLDGRINNVIGNYFSLKDSKSSSGFFSKNMNSQGYMRTSDNLEGGQSSNNYYEGVKSNTLPEIKIDTEN